MHMFFFFLICIHWVIFIMCSTQIQLEDCLIQTIHLSSLIYKMNIYWLFLTNRCMHVYAVCASTVICEQNQSSLIKIRGDSGLLPIKGCILETRCPLNSLLHIDSITNWKRSKVCLERGEFPKPLNWLSFTFTLKLIGEICGQNSAFQASIW